MLSRSSFAITVSIFMFVDLPRLITFFILQQVVAEFLMELAEYAGSGLANTDIIFVLEKKVKAVAYFCIRYLCYDLCA
jgi:hypothetical protein